MVSGPTIRIHRGGYVSAGGKTIGRVYRDPWDFRKWAARAVSSLDVNAAAGPVIARTVLRREAVDALLDHVYGMERWS